MRQRHRLATALATSLALAACTGMSSTGSGGTRQAGDSRQAAVASTLVRMISEQITPCWNIPEGAKGKAVKAELHIVLQPDGSVRSVEVVDSERMVSDPAFRKFAESTIRAVRACSPLKLPSEQYQMWRNIFFNFDSSLDPNEMSRLLSPPPASNPPAGTPPPPVPSTPHGQTAAPPTPAAPADDSAQLEGTEGRQQAIVSQAQQGL